MSTTPGNTPEYSVSDIAGAVKRTVEAAFGQVRVRGELSQFKRFASGHWYGRVKDERAVLEIVMWKGAAAAMRFRPEDGMEVVAIGRLTTYPGSSKYQLVVERLEPAGVGALLAQLEARREALRAEGLFARERKKPIPYLPAHIGVVTSPTGAVIRDILHRLADRFPRRVTLWPVAVQGEGAAAQIAAAIAGMNALPPADRSDVLIVARGGGSVEDLWAFNEEVVVRAAAASAIPLISAVGHETDTTLIDYAADRRAPTPTAAAEMAVPVRAELAEQVAALGLRLARGERRGRAAAIERFRALRLPRPAGLVALPRQRLDDATERLPRALATAAARRRAGLDRAAVRLRPALLAARAVDGRAALARADRDSARALGSMLRAARAALARPAAVPNAALLAALRDARGARLSVVARALPRALATRVSAGRARLERPAATPNLRLVVQRLAAGRSAMASAFRLVEGLGPQATLARGYAIVTDRGGNVVRSADAARAARRLNLRFADGEVLATAAGVDGHGDASPSPPQGRLL